MILVDANLLVYAKVSDFSQHEQVREWLDSELGGRTGVGLPWPSLLAFVRLVSNPRIFERALAVSEAWKQVEEWLDLAVTWIPEPTERHRSILASLIPEVGRAELVPDAHLAALAMEYGLVLQTTDRDFSRFSGLRWRNPLEG
ncbi:MAG: type II toxin-antitoxin system VapC family toxin [Gemmatimonadota bacterium]